MRNVMVCVIIFMSITIACVGADNNSSVVTTDTTSNKTTGHKMNISTFEEDYSKPASQSSQGQTANATAQGTATNKKANVSTFEEDYSKPVLQSSRDQAADVTTQTATNVKSQAAN
jgi:hypothetical protein